MLAHHRNFTPPYAHVASRNIVQSNYRLLLIYPIDTAENLPSIFRRITKGFESHSNAVEIYNKMLSCMKASAIVDAYYSEGGWQRSSEFSAYQLNKAIDQLIAEYQTKHKDEAYLEATVLKSKLTQINMDYMSFQSLDPDKTNQIDGEMLARFSFGKPNPTATPAFAPAQLTTMGYRTRQPHRRIDIDFEPFRRSSSLTRHY